MNNLTEKSALDLISEARKKVKLLHYTGKDGTPKTDLIKIISELEKRIGFLNDQSW